MKRTMCVWLPNWPIQRVRQERGEPGDRPLVLYIAAARGTLTVTACSPSAAREGVRVDMPLAEAESLCLPSPPVLRGRGAGGEGAKPGRGTTPSRDPGNAYFLKHDRNADRIGLRTLALYCDRYTPIVALEEADAPESLLLDITGSSHLFGGEQRLAEKVIADLRQLGYSARVAIADGIGAAWAVAHSPWDPAVCSTGLRTRPCPDERHDSECSDGSGDPSYGIVVPLGKNRDIVPELGVDVLRLPPDVVHLLHQFDLRCIRQLMELPRGQVAVRFGHETLTRLDQALGVIPEILIPERRASPVRAVWSFEDPVSHPHVIEKVLERLIRQMVETLTPRQTGVRRLVCALTTADKNRTEFTVGLLHPTLSAERLLSLVRLRLEGVNLPAAVTTIKVRAAVAPLDIRQQRWFDSEDDARRETAFRDFVERVSSRLGEEAVLQPRLLPEEQPELAWEYVPWLRQPAQPASESSACPAYPINLLTPLAVRVETGPADERPRQFAWRQRLYEITRAWGPQRIETGWWRGNDIRRDYYRVEADGGERFWIFRDRTRGTWFLHGVYA